MGLTASTTKDGVVVHAHTADGTPVEIKLSLWEAACFADELRGRAQAHAVSVSGDFGRGAVIVAPHAHTFVASAPAYIRDAEPFTEDEVNRIVCGLTL